MPAREYWFLPVEAEELSNGNYKDIMVKLSDWERYLRVWNIWTPRKEI